MPRPHFSSRMPVATRNMAIFSPALGQRGDDIDPPYRIAPSKLGIRLGDKEPAEFRPMFTVNIATGVITLNRLKEVLGYEYGTRQD